MGIFISIEDISMLHEPIDRAMREGEARDRAKRTTIFLDGVRESRFGRSHWLNN